jgi:2-succinyl-6-hydroxy-2,4-cyclohexadiene-1-carboxylate synthase
MGVIWCLHGFLGRGADWDFLRDAGFDIRAPSLFAGDSLDSVQPGANDVILGYSMGARLALQVIRDRPVARAVLISAGAAPAEPGRKELDETWARRFESEPWDSLMEAWNTQAVFGGRRNPLQRKEAEYNRPALAAALRTWSAAVLRPRFSDITVPTLWIAGAVDPKYSDAARHASERLPNAELWICPDAGHRVPWEQPDRFIARLREFVPPR